MFKQFSISKKILIHSLLMFLTLGTVTAHASDQEDKAWKALQQGEAIAIMRHVHAPNTNEVSLFGPEKCADERNISKEGATQARAVGAKLRANKITKAEVYSTSLCRGIDTAILLEYGDVTELPEIDSYYENPSVEIAQTNALRKWIKNTIKQKSTTSVLVTHKFNITSLIDIKSEQGDVFIIGIENDKLVSLHQFSTPLE